MNAWWQLWQNAAAKDWCEDLIAAGLTLAPAEGTIGHGAEPVVNKGFRRSIVRWLPKEWVNVYDFIEYHCRYANTVAYGFDLSMLREVQFTEYSSEDQGHYDWHEDLSWTSPALYHRKLSFVCQLSDPATYSGGDLELQHEPPAADVLRGQGTVIVFPSFHRHRVTPMKWGKRYSLVAWMDGAKFR